MSIPKKSPYVWSPVAPHRAGRFWFRYSESSGAEIVEVFRLSGETEWSVRFLEEPACEEDESGHREDWCINQHGAQWAGPIPEPMEAPAEDSIFPDTTLPFPPSV